MEIPKQQHAHKQTVIVIGLMGALIISFFAASSSTSYLYRSRANENPQMIKSDQDSIAITTIDTENYSCIKSLTYLPSETDRGCFSQIECNEGTTVTIPEMCQEGDGILSCNADSSSCVSTKEWLDTAAQICGCQ